MRFLTHGKPDMGQNEFQGIPLQEMTQSPICLCFMTLLNLIYIFYRATTGGINTGESPKILLS